MSASQTSTASQKTGSEPVLSRHRWRLLWILAAFVVFRSPFVFRELTGQDEQLFAVPGLLIARGELPRIPYYPVRDPDGFFYRADEILLEMPPGLFYLQAPFYLVLPPGVAPGRMPSLIAGMIAIWLVFELARRAFGSDAAIWGAGCYAASRVLFFAATFARPDECCAAFGLGALVVLWDALAIGSRGRIAIAGALLGAGLLCHPFAITFCLLCGIWTLIAGRKDWGRILDAGILTGTTISVFALWIPLILQSPEIFRHQFFNTMNLTGPGLTQRLLWPWPYVWHQGRLLYEQAGVWQFWLMVVGLLAATVLAATRPSRSARQLVALTWGSLYLLTGCQGMHPTKGYWCFTGALVLACAGAAFRSLTMLSVTSRRSWPRIVVAAMMFAAFVPGAGLRMWWLHVRPDPDARYDGPAFLRAMLAELPAEGHFVAEFPFVMDFWLSGRDVITRADKRDYLIDEFDYDYLVVGRDGLAKGIPEQLKGRLVRSFGMRDDPLSCYAEVYEPLKRRRPESP